MVGGCEGLGIVSGAGAVAQAVGGVAEEGATLGDVQIAQRVLFSENNRAGPLLMLEKPIDLGLADSALGPLGVGNRLFDKEGVGIRAIVVGAMFPNISGHVIESELIGRVGLDGGGAGEAIVAGIFVGEFSGENIGEPFLAGFCFGAPDVIETFLTSARGKFPFRFGREAFPNPLAVGIGILPSHANDGVVFFSFQIGTGAGGVFPISTGFKAPPLPLSSLAAEIHRLRWAGEHERAGFEGFGRGFGEVFDRPTALGLGFVAGCIDEFLELRIRDFVDVEVKTADGDFMDGAFFRVEGEVRVLFRAASVGLAFDPDHAFGSGFRGVGQRNGIGCLEEGDCGEEKEKAFHEAWIPEEDNLSTGMAITKFRPCIDLHEGQVKQIVGSTLNESGAVENFVSEKSPSWYAEKFASDDLRGGHVIKLGPGNDEAAREALGAWPGGLQLGGGISLENAAQWLDAGASEVIVTSWFFDAKGRFLEERAEALAAEIGADKVVIDLSCRALEEGWKVAMNRWQTITEMAVDLATIERLSKYCGEFLIHAADVEGKCGGVDVPLVNLLGEWTGCAITYAGGVRGLQDLELIQKASGGRLDATVGSALDLFGGAGVSYAELLEWNRG